jgi:serine/threonine-protein kinase
MGALPLNAGSRVGPFEIVSSLGSGGMGEVYRARDTRLQREVALKILRPEVAHDPERTARFARESRVLASLNHPNIAQLYGLEESAGVTALVMELVDGPTIADRIARGALPVDDVLLIARQIAEALEAAHDQNIIHRDLKPANIKVRPDGVVKVLDFGLAKALVSDGNQTDGSQGSTVTRWATTHHGLVVGTTAYMSPEQARGEVTDRRTDLWAFGAVLYEMLTGSRAFGRPTTVETIAAVQHEDPDWGRLPPGTPVAIRRLLRRCLEKDRKHRLDSATAARLDIEDARIGPGTHSPNRPPNRLVPLAIVSGLGLVVVAALATSRLTRPEPPAPAPLTRFTFVPPATLPLELQGVDRDFALAPDGTFLVYRAGSQAQLVVRHLDRLETSPLQGVTNARGPFVSPDSRWIGFVENNTTLRKIAVSGGAPVTLARLPGSPRGATWIDDTTVVIATNATGLLRVPADGGEPTPLTSPDDAQGELGHYYPSALPDGRAVLFTVVAAERENTQVAVLDLESKARTALVRGAADASYLPSGHLMYVSAGTLFAVGFDLPRRAIVGHAVPVVEGVSVAEFGIANAAVTGGGTLAYVPRGADQLVERSLVWVDRKGRETATAVPPGPYAALRLSPDGTRVAIEVRDPGSHISIADLRRPSLARLTLGGGLAPVWTMNGARVLFASGGAVTPNLFARAADGSGADIRLSTSANVQVPTSVTPDGNFLLAVERRPQTGSDLVRVRLGAGPTDTPAEGLIDLPYTEQNAEVSPDGRFLAYESNESGRFGVYVRPYPAVGNGVWLVAASGTRPAWTRGGRELIYLDGSNHLTSVEVDTTRGTFRSAAPVTLSTTAYSTTVAWRTYDVWPDGQRFLVLKDKPGESQASPSFVIVQNWFQEVKAKVR